MAGRVAVSATVLEEVMEGFSLQTVMAALKPDFVVIGEATELNLNRGGRGRAEMHLETIGKPAHSSSPHLGVNAVHEMIKLIDIVEHTPLDSHPLLGPALLVLTDMISDPYPGHSVIPSRCRVTYRRTLPGETAASVLGAIAASLARGHPLRRHDCQRRASRLHWRRAVRSQVLSGLGIRRGASLRAGGRGRTALAGLTPKIGAYRFCTKARPARAMRHPDGGLWPHGRKGTRTWWTSGWGLGSWWRRGAGIQQLWRKCWVGKS